MPSEHFPFAAEAVEAMCVTRETTYSNDDDVPTPDVFRNVNGNGTAPSHHVVDSAYGTPCSCHLYGMNQVLPVSEGWEVSDLRKEENHTLDYVYYPPSGYPFPVHSHPTTPTLTGSTPFTPTHASSLIPTTVQSLKTLKEPLQKDQVGMIYEDQNRFLFPHQPPSLSSTAASQSVTHPYPCLVDETSKFGSFGADGCWYSHAGTQTNSSINHTPASPLKPPVYLPYVPVDHSLLIQSYDPTTLIPSPYDPVTYIPSSDCASSNSASPSSSTSSLSSTPPSAIPVTLNHVPVVGGVSPSGQKGIQFYNYYQHLNQAQGVFGKPHLFSSVKKEGRMSLEDLWINHMSVLFKHLPDEWVLSAADPDRKVSSKWFTFRDLAKVRFYCKTCKDGWTSMYGVVLFHYRWNKTLLQGQIIYKVAGQKCGGTCSSKVFQLPLWYPEEAQKVITNLYYKIAAQFYDLVTPQYIRTRRYGQPSTHHNRSLCEGCVQGMCKIDSAAADVKPMSIIITLPHCSLILCISC